MEIFTFDLSKTNISFPPLTTELSIEGFFLWVGLFLIAIYISDITTLLKGYLIPNRLQELRRVSKHCGIDTAKMIDSNHAGFALAVMFVHYCLIKQEGYTVMPVLLFFIISYYASISLSAYGEIERQLYKNGYRFTTPDPSIKFEIFLRSTLAKITDWHRLKLRLKTLTIQPLKAKEHDNQAVKIASGLFSFFTAGNIFNLLGGLLPDSLRFALMAYIGIYIYRLINNYYWGAKHSNASQATQEENKRDKKQEGKQYGFNRSRFHDWSEKDRKNHQHYSNMEKDSGATANEKDISRRRRKALEKKYADKNVT